MAKLSRRNRHLPPRRRPPHLSPAYVRLELVPGAGQVVPEKAWVFLRALEAALGPPPLRRSLTAEEREALADMAAWLEARQRHVDAAELRAALEGVA